jgi:MFS transporter, MHS family, shikimate and dehydroshikimate transport protein
MSGMSASALDSEPALAAPSPLWRIIVASVIGSMIEWYDFTLYGAAAALVFGKLFFPSADPAVGVLLSIAVYGVGFFARPFGGALFGHFGDRIGRKTMLALTVTIMGAGTFLIGCLPTYGQVGILAPTLLIALRLVQGVGLGGEWGGAVLMMVEYAKPGQRGLFGSLVQAGYPFGVLSSIGVFALVSGAMSDADFQSWGWRIPFLVSIVLVGVGLWIRLSVTETPAFRRLLADVGVKRAPLIEVLTFYRPMFFIAIGLKVSEIAWALIGAVVSIVYVTGKLGMPKATVLTAIQIASVVQLLITPFYGWLSDRIGRKPLFIFACMFSMAFAFPLFWLLDTKDPFLIIVAISIAIGVGQGVMFGVGGAFMSELFTTGVRYSGASMGFQIGAALSGGLTPIIATWLLKSSGGQSWGISLYLIVLAAITLVATLRAPETAHEPLR